MSYSQSLGQFNFNVGLPGGAPAIPPPSTSKKGRGGPVRSGVSPSSEVTALRSEIASLKSSVASYQSRLDVLNKQYKDGLAAMTRHKAELTAQFRYASNHSGRRERDRMAAELAALHKKMSAYSMETFKKAASLAGSIKKLKGQIVLKEKILSLAVTHEQDAARQADVARQADDLKRQAADLKREQDARDRAARDLQDQQDAFRAQQERQAQDLQDQQDAFRAQQDAFRAQQEQARQDVLDAQTARSTEPLRDPRAGRKKALLIALGLGVVVVGGVVVMRGGK